MGKATRWLKGLLGMKKEREESLVLDKKEKKQSAKDEVSHIAPTCVRTFDRARNKSYVGERANLKNKIVRSRSCDKVTLLIGSREGWAALKIQSFFRGYLSRKALRALKGLVKIQALVRGYLVRKRVAATLQSMQAMIRAQAVARSVRALRSIDKENRFHPETPPRKYLQRFGETRNELQARRVPIYHKTHLKEFDESAKVVEVDTHMPHSRCRSINTSAMSECGDDIHYQAISSSSLHCPAQGRISLHENRNSQEFEWFFNEGNNKFSTAHNTPRLAKCMLPSTPATPVKSVYGDTIFRPCCSNFPNYMANTHSSKAKLRSHSAPKQRPEFQKRLSINEVIAARNSVSGVRLQWSSSNPKTQDYCFYDKVI